VAFSCHACNSPEIAGRALARLFTASVISLGVLIGLRAVAKNRWKSCGALLRTVSSQPTARRCERPNPFEASPMSIFQCSQCGCAEDTALCRYWSARVRDTAPMCSACDPKIGRWHHQFPRAPFAVFHEHEFQRLLGTSWVRTRVTRQTASAA
jgi:hypothetical protein